ncbi:MAG: exodeoxyribonuclease VII small subunit [Lachnospiraceae bacterium]|nr:exodeoxyribonuclease VII small subunit [Lachnospiraceae bacterium]
MPDIEENFKELEKIIADLGSDEVSLEESFVMYEKGMRLLKVCNEQLDKVEKKLIVLKEGVHVEE